VAIVVAADPAAGPVSGDPDRLQQVVGNLLSNAVKFTPAGGRVAVRVERLDGDAAITVLDDGAGIAAEVLPHIFERFRQADSSTTRRHGGLGLGLAIVKHLTELHGGSVEAASEGRGRGTRFTVRLPLSAAQTAPALAGATRGRDRTLPSLTGVRALVVEDELDSRELVAALLEQCGAQVRTVASSSAALTAVVDSAPDVIIADIGMAGEDGYGMMRRLRALPPEAGGTIPAVALTAFVRPEDVEHARAAGFQLHLAKPVDPAALAHAIARTLGRETPV
jgi:CheY-like chemotaxis protein/anti-sigma regulatory factor (Ser/Thr protein kinase)